MFRIILKLLEKSVRNNTILHEILTGTKSDEEN